MNEQTKREHLIKIINGVLNTNIELMTYYKSIAIDEKSKQVCAKSIRQTKKSIEKLKSIKHFEILQSLYNAIIGGKEVVFVTAGSLISSKMFNWYDKTEKGFKKFLELEEESKKETQNRLKEEQENKEFVEKAKANGKKVSYAYVNGKLKPVIEEEPKA